MVRRMGNTKDWDYSSQYLVREDLKKREPFKQRLNENVSHVDVWGRVLREKKPAVQRLSGRSMCGTSKELQET